MHFRSRPCTVFGTDVQVFLALKKNGKPQIDRAHRLRKQGQKEAAHKIKQQAQKLPAIDPQDSDYRRLKYCRYADDVRHLTH